MPTLAELQTFDRQQSKAQLQTLLLEFSATLARLPSLQRELQNWLNQDAQVVDYNALSARAEAALVMATDWLLEYDLLKPEIKQSTPMQEFMRTVAETVTCRTVAGMVRDFGEAKKNSAQEVEKNNQLLATKQQKEVDRTIKHINEALAALEDRAKNEVYQIDTTEFLVDFFSKIHEAVNTVTELTGGINKLLGEANEITRNVEQNALLKNHFSTAISAGMHYAVIANLFILSHQKFLIQKIEDDDKKIFFGKLSKELRVKIEETIKFLETQKGIFDTQISFFDFFNKMLEGLNGD